LLNTTQHEIDCDLEACEVCRLLSLPPGDDIPAPYPGNVNHHLALHIVDDAPRIALISTATADA
jgi:hypothetical protein